jgi:anti-sigma B factor antagonist
MDIVKTKNGPELTVSVKGKLDLKTSPLFEKDMSGSLNGITDLILDFRDLEYITSAGLRVILTLYQTVAKKGNVVIRNPNSLVRRVFEATGLTDILEVR